MASVDLDAIRHALSLAREKGFREVELEIGETRFSAGLSAKTPPRPPAPAEPTEQEVPVASPVVGYLSKVRPSLKVGSKVEEGERLACVTALGLDTDLTAPCSGELVSIEAKEGEPLEYGQTVAVIRKRRGDA
ncbi:MAG: acetyl-CoA carboxylase biotin carboxyl carrier protein subunit [Fimbriimonadales bacterium]|nr:acetyl-CoA carboxylase biotin carboxyl carrier protein subunit [Fimbriimonadales bacterium]